MTTRTEITKTQAPLKTNLTSAIPDSVLINVASAMNIKTYAKLKTLADSIGKSADLDFACEALSIEKKEAKAPPVITTNVGEYQGKPVFQFKSGNYNYLSFGKEKAKVILANIEAIAAFANS